ncbi:uncharacterized protein LOC111347061 isoform X2 [Stylophora pistillata]|uniref:uncharacterized protein LOC111347061 isoform X2 n=1 Tax=Stylophora pistillata TaxID=50429 RepID=UPI000C04F5BE|nr:uncharacterized protein LOC111347061 isoform X2 [Stylophora pistillata]
MFWRVFFLALVIDPTCSNQCSRGYPEMKLRGIKDTCQRIGNGTGFSSFKIRCHYYIQRYCTVWCRDFAYCLGQSVRWQEKCARRFNRLFRRGHWTNIKVHAEGIGTPYNIHVHFCGWEWSYKVYTIEIKLFDIATQDDEQQKGMDSPKEDILDSLRSITEHFTHETCSKSENKKDKIEDMFLELTSLETSLLEKAQLNFHRTTPEFNMRSVHVDVLVRKIFHQNESHHFHLEESKGQNFLSIPSKNLYNGLSIYFNISCFLIDSYFI